MNRFYRPDVAAIATILRNSQACTLLMIFTARFSCWSNYHSRSISNSANWPRFKVVVAIAVAVAFVVIVCRCTAINRQQELQTKLVLSDAFCLALVKQNNLRAHNNNKIMSFAISRRMPVVHFLLPLPPDVIERD